MIFMAYKRETYEWTMHNYIVFVHDIPRVISIIVETFSMNEQIALFCQYF